MTPEGFAALKSELAELKAERPKISQQIGEAADQAEIDRIRVLFDDLERNNAGLQADFCDQHDL